MNLSNKKPSEIRLQDGTTRRVFNHLVDGSVLIGDEMNHTHVPLGEFEVTEWIIEDSFL